MSSYFSSEYRASYNKFLATGMASIFVSLFHIKTLSFVGVAGEKLDSEVFAFLFLTVGSWSAVSFLLVHLDERKKLSELAEQLATYHSRVSGNLSGILNAANNFEKSTNDGFIAIGNKLHTLRQEMELHEGLYSNSIHLFNQGVEPSDKEISSVKQGYKFFAQDVVRALESLKREVQSLEKIKTNMEPKFSAASVELNAITSDLKLLNSKFTEIKNFPRWVNLRIWLMDILTPIFLFLAMLVSYVFSEEVFGFLKFISGIANN